jgi:hypothetical protein
MFSDKVKKVSKLKISKSKFLKPGGSIKLKNFMMFLEELGKEEFVLQIKLLLYFFLVTRVRQISLDTMMVGKVMYFTILERELKETWK